HCKVASSLMPRPLFRKSGEELLQLFEKWKNSPPELQILADELSRRTRPKTIALRRRLEAQLQKLNSSGARTVPTELPLIDKKSEAAAGPSTPKTKSESEDDDSLIPGTDYFAAPEEFTLVEPLGVKGRQTA